MQLLIAEGADLSATTKSGDTIEDICRRFHHLELADVQLLASRWLTILSDDMVHELSLKEFKAIDTDHSGYIGRCAE